MEYKNGIRAMFESIHSFLERLFFRKKYHKMARARAAIACTASRAPLHYFNASVSILLRFCQLVLCEKHGV
jgi:hypothetical protein